MHPTSRDSSLTVAPQPRHLLLRFAFGLVVAIFALIVSVPLVVASYFGLRGDLALLKRELGKTTDTTWNRVVEVNIGRGTFALARFAMGFVTLDPEVRAAANTLRAAQVGVYQLDPTGHRGDQRALLSAAETTMIGQGWDRVVGVSRPGQCVAVYVPSGMKSLANVQVCVLVMEHDQVVLVGAKANPEALIKLLMERGELGLTNHSGHRVGFGGNRGS